LSSLVVAVVERRVAVEAAQEAFAQARLYQ
jgi:hypothetical protein